MFFDRFAPAVERVICKLLPYPSSWDDALSETFARAFASMRKLGPHDRIKSWLMGVAANVAREQRKSARRPHWQTADDDAIEPLAGVSDPEAREAVRTVHDVCGRMNDDDAQLVLLR